MNSYFTDLVGDEDSSYLHAMLSLSWKRLLDNFDPAKYERHKYDYIHPGIPCKEALEEMARISQQLGLYEMVNQMCSCGSRQKHKCVKESESGYGKMCLKEE